MRLTRLDIVLIVLTIVAIAAWAFVAYSLGLLNLRDTVTIILSELVVAAKLALSRILGREPDTNELARRIAEEKQKLEEIDRNRKAIYEAIKEWVQPSPTRWQMGGQQEPLYLAEKHPALAVKIDECLNLNYHPIWIDLQEFKRIYADLVALREHPPEEFYERIDGKLNFDLRRLEGRELSMRDQLRAIQRQLVQQINLEIVEKGDTELKC